MAEERDKQKKNETITISVPGRWGFFNSFTGFMACFLFGAVIIAPGEFVLLGHISHPSEIDRSQVFDVSKPVMWTQILTHEKMREWGFINQLGQPHPTIPGDWKPLPDNWIPGDIDSPRFKNMTYSEAKESMRQSMRNDLCWRNHEECMMGGHNFTATQTGKCYCSNIWFTHRPKEEIGRTLRNLADKLFNIIDNPASDPLHVQAAKSSVSDLMALAGDIALHQSDVYVRNTTREITRTRDILHDLLWYPYCNEYGRWRGCRYLSPLKPYLRHAPTWVFIAWTCFFCVLACTLNREYIFATHAAFSMCIARVLRILTYMSTMLGPINPDCRQMYRGASESGGCGDLLFSGHGVVVSITICVIWTQNIPFRIPLIFKILLTLVCLQNMAASAVERFHYTADMVLALFITIAVWMGAADFTGFTYRKSVMEETQQGSQVSIVGIVIPVSFVIFGLYYFASIGVLDL